MAHLYTRISTQEGRSLLEDGGHVVEVLTVSARRGHYEITDTIPAHLAAPPTTSYWILHFEGPVKGEWLSALDALPAKTLDYVPHDALLLRTDPLTKDKIASYPWTRNLVPHHPAFKLSPLVPSAGVANLTATADRDADVSLILQRVELAGATIHDFTTTPTRHVIRFAADPATVERVASIDEVLWVEPSLNELGALLAKGSSITQSGREGYFSIHGRGVDGRDQIVVACDNGLFTSVNDEYDGRTLLWAQHPVFNQSDLLTPPDPLVGQFEFNAHLANPPLTLPEHRKIGLYYAPYEGGEPRGDHSAHETNEGIYPHHHTQVASIIAGDTMPWGERDSRDGIAYNATLLICDMAIGDEYQHLNDQWNYLAPAYEYGARIASFSVGATYRTTSYLEPARQTDEIAWLHRNLTILRAIGNDGGNSMVPESVAKNILTIGGTENQPTDEKYLVDGNPEEVAVWSAKGPTADGRTKPNLVAPGFCVESARGTSDYACASGTSYATPMAAGAVALARDYLARGFLPGEAARSDPSSALLRAMMMVSGRDLTGVVDPTFPNGEQGWGRLLLEDVLYFGEAGEDRKLILADESDTPNTPIINASGERWARGFRVHGPGEVRIFLAWTDYPAAAGAVTAIVNDLDLRVGGPGCDDGLLDPVCIGNAFVGNETQPGKENLPDRINVEEAVYLCRAPVAGQPCAVPTGDYSVAVQGFRIARAEGQPFAITITGNVSWID